MDRGGKARDNARITNGIKIADPATANGTPQLALLAMTSNENKISHRSGRRKWHPVESH